MDKDTKYIFSKFPARKENLLNILHALQDNHPSHCLPEATLAEVADYLNLPKSSVFGVATYYSMFSIKPRGRNIIRVCVSPVCNLMKGDELLAALENLLGIKPGETTPCETFTLETSECLGFCVASPCMMVNRDVYGDLNEKKAQEIIEVFRNQTELPQSRNNHD